MNVQVRPRATTAERRLPFECVALVLQAAARLAPTRLESTRRWPRPHPSDWVAGISIGAINSALIAGNPPERRVDRLRAFWEGITTGWSWFDWRTCRKAMQRGSR